MITASAPASLSYDELAAQLATCQAEKKALQDELGVCQRRWVMVKEIVGNKETTDADKVLALAGIVVYEHKTKINVVKAVAAGVSLPTVPIYRAEIAHASGKSEQAVGDGLKRQAQLGAAMVNTTYQKDAGGLPLSQLHYAPTPALITRPARLKYADTDKPKKWGGKRETCKTCGSDHIVERRNWYCADCGELYRAFEDKPVNPPDLHPVVLVTEPVPAPESEAIAQVPVTRNSFPVVHLDSPDEQAESREQIMDCGHSPSALHRIRGKWICGLCPAPDKPARAGTVCHDCGVALPNYAARGIWIAGKAAIVCPDCRIVRERQTGGKSA